MKRILNRYPVASVMLLMLLCLAPVMAMRDFSPGNELRYMSIANEAIANGDVFAFTNHGIPYADKPPLYFWIIMLCRLIFGQHSMFVLCLFSFIPAMVIIAVMDKWFLGRAVEHRFSSGERAGTALLLATSGLFLGMSIFLRMDMLMCMWIVLAMYSFSRDKVVPFAVYTFLALFTKGPVGLLVPILSVPVYLVSEGRGRETGKWLGWKTWGVLALGCAVWFIGVFLDGGTEYLNNLLFHQTVGRAVNSFHHKAPFWYYCVGIWEVMAPWCLATVSALIVSFFVKDKPKMAKLGGLTVLTTFIMLSCFSSKIAIYMAPMFPFIVYVFPLVEEKTGYTGWMKAAFVIPGVLFTVLGVAIVAAVAGWNTLSDFLLSKGTDISAYAFAASPLAIGAGLVLAAGGVLGIANAFKAWYKSVIPVGTSLLVALFLISWMMPSINQFVGYRDICSHVPEGVELYAWKCYRPENVDVYLGRDITILEDDNALPESLVPEDAALMVRTTKLPEGLDGRDSVVSGDYTLYLPKAE